ncbi:DNA-binding response OmpR family regulator [Rhodoblastus acidophilus]|uniref:response regulator transcription factor n=1 Tax=Rhodoblastus acidophilus TaxID=1074 RepID=UPI0022245B16|nr:DNA-binding response regulator [Rhodoblastus acidophilus]MCW2318758.1 DNA-binding response OmpR family regulator [Rhodoblastus acidophilus]
MPTDLLLIDDSLTDLRLLMDMASGLQLRCSVAFDGKKGYQQAVLQKPSLILLDVHMPGIDGFATCRLLKANPATFATPVIFLTAANGLDERLKGFALGAVDYIGKPFHEAEVLARIGVHVRLSQKGAEAAETSPVDHDIRAAPQYAVLVRAAKDILNARIADPPSLEDLARLLGSNRRQINEAFQACCGQPTFGWLREERLRRAHHLVCSTDTPISQIGEHLGYSAPANFTRAFNDRFGFSPRDLRRNIWVARQCARQEAE